MKEKPKPVSPEQAQRLQEGPYLSEILPLDVSGGRLTSIQVDCLSCDEPLPQEQTAVTLSRPIEGVQVLDLVAVCHRCRFVTTAYMRVMPDGRMQSIVGHEWREYPLFNRPQPLPWWDLWGRLRRWWRSLYAQ